MICAESGTVWSEVCEDRKEEPAEAVFRAEQPADAEGGMIIIEIDRCIVELILQLPAGHLLRQEGNRHQIMILPSVLRQHPVFLHILLIDRRARERRQYRRLQLIGIDFLGKGNGAPDILCAVLIKTQDDAGDQTDAMIAAGCGSSADVIDILILDGSNQVTYSARNSVFGSGSLTLVRAGQGSDYLLSDKDASVVFKSVKSKEFMLSSVFSQDFGSVREEYDNTCFYESGFSDRTVCLLSYLSGQDGSAKIYIITSPTSVPGGSLTLRVDACIAMLFFMIYWVLLALWVFRNAARSRLSPLFWGLIVLLTNIAGLLVYQLYKHGNAACPSCGASQSKSHLYCVNCGEPMGAKCPRCGAHVSAGDRFCPHCGSKLA